MGKDITLTNCVIITILDEKFNLNLLKLHLNRKLFRNDIYDIDLNKMEFEIDNYKYLHANNKVGYGNFNGFISNISNINKSIYSAKYLGLSYKQKIEGKERESLHSFSINISDNLAFFRNKKMSKIKPKENKFFGWL